MFPLRQSNGCSTSHETEFTVYQRYANPILIHPSINLFIHPSHLQCDMNMKNLVSPVGAKISPITLRAFGHHDLYEEEPHGGITWKTEMDFSVLLNSSVNVIQLILMVVPCDASNGPDSPLNLSQATARVAFFLQFKKCYCNVKNTVFQWIELLCLTTKPGQKNQNRWRRGWGCDFCSIFNKGRSWKRGRGKKSNPSLISACLHIYFCSKD